MFIVNMRELYYFYAPIAVTVTVSLTSIPQIKALWCGILDIQFIEPKFCLLLLQTLTITDTKSFPRGCLQ